MNKLNYCTLNKFYNLCNLTIKNNPIHNLKALYPLLQAFTPSDYTDYLNINNNNNNNNNNNTYNRQSVFKNNLLEFAIITWLPGQTSGFHKHYNQCLFKVLEHNICEETISGHKQTLYTGNIGYIDQYYQEHNMTNLSTTTKTVTFHIYKQ
jgi:hypothetical protein